MLFVFVWQQVLNGNNDGIDDVDVGGVSLVYVPEEEIEPALQGNLPEIRDGVVAEEELSLLPNPRHRGMRGLNRSETLLTLSRV